MTTQHSTGIPTSPMHVERSDDDRRNTLRAGGLRGLAVAALAGITLSTSALGGWANTSSTLPRMEKSYPISLAASAIEIQPAGRCAFGHNPDGSCRGHKVSDSAKNAYKRCLKHGKDGFNNKTNEEIGEKVWEKAGNVAGGAVASAAGGKALQGAKVLKKGKIFKGAGGKELKGLILSTPGAEPGGKAGKKAGKYIGKGTGAVVGCAIYLNGE